ncbi:uncharacterized protein Dvir_GJ26325, isoform C [Drosophila virilis]|uniref:Uncharacterized protein, isoform C n=1 Tax=Drosophila virilis TaxID=7244 RepID=A0A0Q9WD84_DROVI|nr:uncharacterized protein Dvir_GJ26325, isoform C [Drosophila virilis]
MCIAKFSKGSFEAEIIDSREDREILDQQCQELNKEAATKLNESEATTNDDKSEEPLTAYKSNTDTTNKSNLGQFEAFDDPIEDSESDYSEQRSENDFSISDDDIVEKSKKKESAQIDHHLEKP